MIVVVSVLKVRDPEPQASIEASLVRGRDNGRESVNGDEDSNAESRKEKRAQQARLERAKSVDKVLSII